MGGDDRGQISLGVPRWPGQQCDSLWDADYVARLKIRKALGCSGTPGSTTMRMRSTWDRDLSVLTFWSLDLEDTDEFIYFLLGATSEQATHLDSIAFSRGPIGSTPLHGYVASRPIRWGALPVGNVDATVSIDEQYEIRIHRSTSKRWELLIDARTELPSGATVRGRFDLTTEGPSLPWSSLIIRYSIEHLQGTDAGTLSLERVGGLRPAD